MNKIKHFEKRMDYLTDCFRGHYKSGASWHIFHHRDADGAASKQIPKSSAESKGVSVKTYPFEREFDSELEAVLSDIYENVKKNNLPDPVILFVDLGTGFEKKLDKLSKKYCFNSYIIDHHETNERVVEELENVTVLNSELFIEKSERSISAAVLCYYVFEPLVSRKLAEDFANWAMIGATGDKLEDITKVYRRSDDDKTKNFVLDKSSIIIPAPGNPVRFKNQNDDNHMYNLKKMTNRVDLLCSIGYSHESLDLVEQILKEGYDENVNEVIAELKSYQDEIYTKMSKAIKKGKFIFNDESLFLFSTVVGGENLFSKPLEKSVACSAVGPKTVGLFCDSVVENTLSNFSGVINPNAYVIGVQPYETWEPKPVEEQLSKYSFRVGKDREELIEKSRSESIKDIKTVLDKKLGKNMIGSAFHGLSGAFYTPVLREQFTNQVLIDHYKNI